MTTAIDLLREFQTGIVGLIGFGGVILTLIVNARLARRRVQELREHERQTLARALGAELHEAYEGIEENLRRTREADQRTFMLVPSGPATPIFDRNLERLGLLSDLQIEKVLRAHFALQGLDNKMELISTPVEGQETYRNIELQEHGQLLAGMLKNMLPVINDAVVALRPGS